MAHGAVRFLFWAIEAVALAALLMAAVLAWRLSQGPVPLGPLTPYIATAISSASPGLRLRIAKAQLQWEDLSSSPLLAVEDVSVLDADGAAIAALPSMVVRLNIGQLLRGRPTPEQVRLSSPILRFVRRADGSISLGSEGSAAPSDTGASGNAIAAWLIDALTRPPSSDNPGGYLESVSIDDTTLVLVDEASGLRWLVPDAGLILQRQNGDVRLDATLPVIVDGRRTVFAVTGRYAAASGRLLLDLNVEEFQPAKVASLAPQLAFLNMMDFRLSGAFNAALTLTGGIARLNWLQFDVEGRSGVLRLPAPVDRDYNIESLSLRGAAGAAFDRIVVDHLSVELDQGDEPGPTITAAAVGSELNAVPNVEIDIQIDRLAVDALKSYWPAAVKPNTGSWIKRNLEHGALTDSLIRLRLGGTSIDDLAVTSLDIRSELSGFTVNYIGGLPKVQDASGIMRIGLDEVAIDTLRGRVPDPISGKELNLTGGTLRMYNLGSAQELSDFDIKIEGELPEIMRLIDHAPLGYARAMGIDPGSTEGKAEIDLALDFPLVSDLSLDDLEVAVKAELVDAGIAEAAFGLPARRGTLSLALDENGMDVEGDISLGDIPANVKWRENFGGGDFRSRYIVNAAMDNDQRPLVNLGMAPFTPPYIDGPVPTSIVYTVLRDGTAQLDAQVDLTTVVMAVPELGWRKEIGTPAQGDAKVTLRDGALESVPSFHVTSGDDLNVAGSVEFAEANALQALTFDTAVVGQSDMQGRMLIDEYGVYDLDVTGTAFNATYFWKEFNKDENRSRSDVEEAETAPQTPVKLRASFDRMWLTEAGDFRDVTLAFDRGVGGIRTIDFKSKVDATVPFDFALNTVDGRRTLHGSSAAGGSVVRSIGLFDDIVGGKLDISGELTPNGSVSGVAEVSDFKLVEAPLIARLLSVAALTGIVDELQGQGISFSTLRVPFGFSRSILEIKEAEMFGTSLGLTGRGTYNFQTSRIDVDGTLVPAYAINSALNFIPVLGTILSGGEKGSGIFAATYSYRGEAETAEPTVNPLAALAPGILRRIFDIFKDRSPQEASAPTAQTADPGQPQAN